jgi:hypothetical protein
MLMTKERRPAFPTLRGWTISMLQETGAIRTPGIRPSRSHVRPADRCIGAGGRRCGGRGSRLDRRHLPRVPAAVNGGPSTYFLRTNRFSTRFRPLPTFFTAFLTEAADFPVFIAS